MILKSRSGKFTVFDVSTSTLSRITDRITNDIVVWQNRSLESVYLIVWMDGIVFEYTYIIKGKKQFTIASDVVILEAGQSIKIEKYTSIQYANPFDEPCEYISICTPAFSLELVN